MNEQEQLPLPWCPYCGYEGELRQVMEPRPSTKKTRTCPDCMMVVLP